MSAMKLGTILLQKRLVTKEQLEEALDSQIINGGRLGTNLVELGHLSEARLAEALQAQHQLPAAHGYIEPRPDALEQIKGEWCDKHNLIPLRLEGARLYLGVATPYPAEHAAELGRRLGKEIQQVVLPEFRMNQLLRRHAKAFRPVRPVDLKYAAKGGAEEAEQAKPGGEELMSEEEFQSLYANALSGGRTASIEEAHAEAEAAAPARPHTPSPITGTMPAVTQAPPARPASSPGQALPPHSVLAHPDARVSESHGDASQPSGPHLERRDPSSPGAAPPQDRRKPAPEAEVKLEPLSFAEAQAALAKTEDRDGIARVVMRFASTKFARALLMTLHGNVATGWEGAGAGLTGQKAKRVAVVLGQNSPFKLVRDSRAHFIGPVRRDPSIAAFFKLIGGAPQTSILMPILARGRVVNILYCDSGPDRPTMPDIGELLILSQKVGRSYESMLAKRKQAEAQQPT